MMVPPTCTWSCCVALRSSATSWTRDGSGSRPETTRGTFDHVAVAPIGGRINLRLDQLRARPEGQGLDPYHGRHRFGARQLGERLVIAAKPGVVGADEHVGGVGALKEARVGGVGSSRSSRRGQHDRPGQRHQRG